MLRLKINADGSCFTWNENRITEQQIYKLIEKNKERSALAKENKKAGIEPEPRYYEIDTPAKRKIRCAAAAQFWTKRKKFKVIFVTLTMSDSLKMSHELSNKALILYLQNLKNNYELKSYVGVHEYQKNGASHYHFLLEIPRTDFKKLNDAWCGSISTVLGYTFYSGCAVRVGMYKNGKKISNFVQSPRDAVRYITKYITKCAGRNGGGANGLKRTKKVYFISNNIRNTEASIKQTDKGFEGIRLYIEQNRTQPVYITEYVTYYTIDTYLALQLIDELNT